jgi:hypothetical protein
MMDDLHPEPSEFNIPDDAFDGAVANDPTVHHKAKNAHYSSAWVKGPGSVTLLAEGARDLRQVSELRGEPVTEIAFVRLLVLPSAKTLLVWPSHEKDPLAVQVKWQDGVAKFVASTALRSAKIPVTSGQRNRYTLHVLKESKVGPALAIDMRYELETRILPKPKAKAKAKKVAPDASAAQSEEKQ